MNVFSLKIMSRHYIHNGIISHLLLVTTISYHKSILNHTLLLNYIINVCLYCYSDFLFLVIFLMDFFKRILHISIPG